MGLDGESYEVTIEEGAARPPVVPRYTPHELSESTAIASRTTLT